MSPFGPGTSTRPPGAIFFWISPDATPDATPAEPIAVMPMPMIEPRGSASAGSEIARFGAGVPCASVDGLGPPISPDTDCCEPGSGVRTMSTPGCVGSSVDWTSTLALRRGFGPPSVPDAEDEFDDVIADVEGA